jgi:hypothetical protein
MTTTLIVGDPAGFQIMPWMAFWFGGTLAAGRTVERLNYFNMPGDSSIKSGADTLHARLATVPKPVIYYGHSEGAQVGDWWLNHQGLLVPYSPSDVSFIFSGNPERKYGGVPWLQNRYAPAATAYSVTDYARQYDGWADYPNLASPNGTALLNALWGMLWIHPGYWSESLTKPGNVSKTEGNITYIWSKSAAPSGDSNRTTIEASHSRPVAIPYP